MFLNLTAKIHKFIIRSPFPIKDTMKLSQNICIYLSRKMVFICID